MYGFFGPRPGTQSMSWMMAFSSPCLAEEFICKLEVSAAPGMCGHRDMCVGACMFLCHRLRESVLQFLRDACSRSDKIEILDSTETRCASI
jgi:hypothetical protein